MDEQQEPIPQEREFNGHGVAFPEGLEFFRLVEQLESLCSEATEAKVAHLGIKAPECTGNLGKVISLLYREACCFYGCKGGDHLIQRLTGRMVSHALASFRLIMFGYYDESLALTRNISELANLFFLLKARPELYDQWLASSDSERKRNFSPLKVRLALEADGVPIPFSETEYSDLCSTAVHIHPGTIPQDFNPQGRPILGAIPQEVGILTALNELAASVAIAGLSLTVHLDSGDRKDTLFDVQRALLNSVGEINLSSARDFLRHADLGRPF
jgi:hypothetical protein